MPETTTLEPERSTATEADRAEAREEPRGPIRETQEREVVRDEPTESRTDTRDEPTEERADERPAERRSAPPTAHDERLLPPSETAEFRRRWESIQASFIDSPKESVEEADRLVADLTDRIADGFRSQRTELEARWHRGEKISTEALRQSLQRYRAFFDRLLKL